MGSYNSTRFVEVSFSQTKESLLDKITLNRLGVSDTLYVDTFGNILKREGKGFRMITPHEKEKRDRFYKMNFDLIDFRRKELINYLDCIVRNNF